MEEKYVKAAREILECMGGKDNIASAAHCATRLRLVLKDESKINKDALEEIDLVKGNFNNGGQFQIILGTGIVNKVYAEFIQMANIQEMSKEELKKVAAQKQNPIQKLLKTLADVFVPILPALVASGLLMGINNILTAQGMFVADQSLVEAFPAIKDFAEMVNLFSNAGFTFLPVLIGFSAAKIFGATPILGAVIGAIMIHPDLMNGYGYGQALLDGTVPYWHIFGLSVAKVGYQGTVLPVIASAFCLAVVEKKLRKVVPAMLDNIVTPLLSVLIAGALTFLFIGPVMRGVGDVMTNAVMWLFFDLGAIGGLIYGVTYPLLVITGMHHSLVTAETQIHPCVMSVQKTFSVFLDHIDKTGLPPVMVRRDRNHVITVRHKIGKRLNPYKPNRVIQRMHPEPVDQNRIIKCLLRRFIAVHLQDPFCIMTEMLMPVNQLHGEEMIHVRMRD